MDRAICVNKTENSVSVDPRDVMDVPVLLQQYRGDPIRAVVVYFANRGVNMQQLKAWQEKCPIIYPWDASYYMEKTGYNRIIQVYPLAIIMAKSVDDIKWALSLAIRLSVPFSLKSGGHDHAGASLSNGFIINVSRRNDMKIKVRQPPEVSEYATVVVGSGTLLGHLITELTLIKGVLPIGTCSNTSVMFAAGAGIGLFVRMYGLTLDTLLSANVILADGTLVTASKDEHKDLFWALRGGGGGNFGIVTDLTFEVFQLESVVLYELRFEASKLRNLLEAWQTFAPFAPKELASKIFIVPGKKVLMKGQFIGSSSDLERLLSPYIKYSNSHKIWSSSVYESALYNNETSENPPWYFFYQTLFSEKMKDKVIDLLESFITLSTGGKDGSDLQKSLMTNNCCIIINALGGKFAAVDKEATAFYWRNAHMWLHLSGETKDHMEYDAIKAVIQALYHNLLTAGLALPGKSYGPMYVNFKDLHLTSDEYMDAYYGDNKARLTAIKQRYDPNNVFSGLQTIPVVGNNVKMLPFSF